MEAEGETTRQVDSWQRRTTHRKQHVTSTEDRSRSTSGTAREALGGSKRRAGTATSGRETDNIRPWWGPTDSNEQGDGHVSNGPDGDGDGDRGREEKDRTEQRRTKTEKEEREKRGETPRRMGTQRR